MTKQAKSTRTPFVLGRRGFARISAVEGIRLTAEMDADFREFDRQEFTPEERRAAIVRKYGKAR